MQFVDLDIFSEPETVSPPKPRHRSRSRVSKGELQRLTAEAASFNANVRGRTPLLSEQELRNYSAPRRLDVVQHYVETDMWGIPRIHTAVTAEVVATKPVIAAPPSLDWAFGRIALTTPRTSPYATLIAQEQSLFVELNADDDAAFYALPSPTETSVVASPPPLAGAVINDQVMTEESSETDAAYGHESPLLDSPLSLRIQEKEALEALDEQQQQYLSVSATDERVMMGDGIAALLEVLEATDATWSADIADWMQQHELSRAYAIEEDTLKGDALKIYTDQLGVEGLTALYNVVIALAEASAGRKCAEQAFVVRHLYERNAAPRRKMLFFKNFLTLIERHGGLEHVLEFLEWSRAFVAHAFIKPSDESDEQFFKIDSLCEYELTALITYMRSYVEALRTLALRTSPPVL